MTGDKSVFADQPCLRCERPVRRVGRVIGGHPVCGACAYHFTEPRPCPNCERLSKRLIHNDFYGQSVCDTCRNALTHATCNRCRRYRPVDSHRSKGEPLCKGCNQPEPATHRCPDCNESVVGSGNGRCDTCLVSRRFKQRAELNTAMFDTASGRSLFRAFCSWKSLDRDSPRIVRALDRYARFLKDIETVSGESMAITLDGLLDRFGNDGLRRHQKVVDFLVSVGRLSWDEDRVRDWTEARRIEAIMAEAQKAGVGSLLASYFNFLTTGRARPLSQRTIRGYLRTVLELLVVAKINSLDSIDTVVFEHFLNRHKGSRASLTSFRRYITQATGREIDIRTAPRNSIRKSDRILVDRVRAMRQRLSTSASKAEQRALVVKLVAAYYLVPLEKVLQFDAEDFSFERDRVILKLDGKRHLLPKWLGEAFRAVASTNGGYLFEGRGIGRPLSSAAVNYHLRDL